MSTTTWKLDPAHTDITFSAKHMMITTVRGTFGDVDGTLEIDEAAPTAARGTIRVQAASLSTGFGARDTHLRSPDFFDVERFPEITVAFDGVEALGGDRWRVTADLTIRDVTRPLTFEVERFPEIIVAFDGVEALGGDRWRVTADLTIRDVTRPLTFEVEHVGETVNFQGTRHIAFTAKATLNREDWGLNWNMALETGGWLVGKDVKLVVEVVADEVVAATESERETVGAAA